MNDIYTETSLVFVYGTLKKGLSNTHYLNESKYLGLATTVNPYTLFVCSDFYFPFLVEDKYKDFEQSNITADLYRIDSDTLLNLDRLEAGLYIRKEIEILREGKDIPEIAYIYFWDENISKLKNLNSILKFIES